MSLSHGRIYGARLATRMDIKGESCVLREKWKSGVVRSTLTPASDA